MANIITSNKNASTVAHYSSTAMPGLNKANKMKPNAAGYYKCILGGFNIDNRQGEHYPLTDRVKKMFDQGGTFKRRIDEGNLRGERDHPKLSGMSKREALNRLAIIDPDRVSHHIMSAELVDTKDEHGNQIVLVSGMIRPSGAMGDSLRESLATPEENVAFSVRSFVDLNMRNGQLNKSVTSLLTYDHVMEGGIKTANQFDTVSMESLIFTQADMMAAMSDTTNIGLESNSNLLMVKSDLGWSKVKAVNLASLDWK